MIYLVCMVQSYNTMDTYLTPSMILYSGSVHTFGGGRAQGGGRQGSKLIKYIA